MSSIQPLSQEKLWEEKLVPMIHTIAGQVIPLRFDKYKRSYQFIKREIVEAKNELSMEPAITDAALNTGYERLTQKSDHLKALCKSCYTELESLKEIYAEQPRSLLMIEGTEKNIKTMQALSTTDYYHPIKPLITQHTTPSTHISEASTPSTSKT